jgi:signal-transduction protein with cAMP-binding, CBS, and nucleotidyltransferase domain
MSFLLTAKSRNITNWSVAEEFAATYRQALRDAAVAPESHNSNEVFAQSRQALADAITSHRDGIKRLNELTTQAGEALSAAQLKELTGAFYDELYRHFRLFRSAPVFYQLSMTFLSRATCTILDLTTNQLGLFSRHLPELALVAIGPAGRGEYSPFCPLQLLLVHGEVAEAHSQTVNLFCHTLHDEFEAAGFAIDPHVSPHSEEWRGSLSLWQQRCSNALHPQATEELINICRLIDQHPLGRENSLSTELKELSSNLLGSNDAALANLIERMTALSNGLGIMGGLKLERNSAERGLFKLLDHGLLPFSAALSALALIKKCPAVTSSERIIDLVQRRELDVEWAERMLDTWHNLHNVRLQQELSGSITDHDGRTLCLNPLELSAAQQLALKETLEAVALIQRHVEIIFSGMAG